MNIYNGKYGFNGYVSQLYSLKDFLIKGINIVLELGRSVGSAIRRGSGGKLCPIS